MSFRELRSFTETMRLLGYPQLISMESFSSPNVELVADCCYWLINRYEPAAEIVYNIERESDRVRFFKQVCEIALTKGRIKLNIKRLYQSDRRAVQEMLKLAGVLKRAMSAMDDDDPDFAGLQQMAAQRGITDAKAVQQLCADLTSDGSSLFSLIEQEMHSRGYRQHVLTRATEISEFERKLRELLQRVNQQVEQLQFSISNFNADEVNLEQKIENKKLQLERARKRHKAILAVRPAFLEEYEKHESELQVQFVKYLELYRNLDYLEHQLASYNAAEDALLEEQENKLSIMRERLRKEELKSLRNESNKHRGKRSNGNDNDNIENGAESNANYNNRYKQVGSNSDSELRGKNDSRGVRERNAALESSSASSTDEQQFRRNANKQRNKQRNANQSETDDEEEMDNNEDDDDDEENDSDEEDDEDEDDEDLNSEERLNPAHRDQRKRKRKHKSSESSSRPSNAMGRVRPAASEELSRRQYNMPITQITNSMMNNPISSPKNGLGNVINSVQLPFGNNNNNNNNNNDDTANVLASSGDGSGNVLGINPNINSIFSTGSGNNINNSSNNNTRVSASGSTGRPPIGGNSINTPVPHGNIGANNNANNMNAPSNSYGRNTNTATSSDTGSSDNDDDNDSEDDDSDDDDDDDDDESEDSSEDTNDSDL